MVTERASWANLNSGSQSDRHLCVTAPEPF
jgi:hypothetical protein